MQLPNIYTAYLISQNNYVTATGFSDMHDEAISHDQVSRFIRKNEFDLKTLWQYVKSSFREHQAATGGVLLLDDSIEENHTKMKRFSQSKLAWWPK